MENRFKWSAAGLLAGVVFPLIFLLVDRKPDLVFLTQWVAFLIPVAAGIFGFFTGLISDGFIRENEDLKKKISDYRQEMMDQTLSLSAEINSAMEDLQKNSAQLDTIVNNINSGICFVDKNFNIEPGFNDMFISIFGDKDYQGSSILNTVFSILDNNLKKSISEYLELCFVNRTASPGMLNDANPVKNFEFVRVVDGAVIHSMIQTGISIIRNKEKEIEKIMLIFDDITGEYELKKELQERDREYGKRYSIMVSLFSNDKSVIKRFIQGLEDDTQSLSSRIQEIKQNEKNSAVVIDLLGIVHSIKGEAFALGFKELAETAGEFELFFKRIKDEVIGLENNLEIISFFERLNNEKKEFDKTINALQEFLSDDGDEVQSVKKDSSDLDISVSKEKHLAHEDVSFHLLCKELELITESSAEELSRECRFKLNTDLAGIDGRRYKVLKEIFLHMVRNSIAHGIESPEERLSTGKSQTGTISLDIRKEGGSIIFIYSDDGGGFDTGKIRDKALEEGLISRESSAGMKEKDILRLVFSDGFSTADSGGMISGTGVGMSVIRKNVFRSLQGKLSLTNRPGEGIRVRIVIPE